MIVEDEPHAMQLLEDHIGKTALLDLRSCCYDAGEALAFLATNKVDVIFLDINMPLLSGLEMAAMIAPDQKIIFTTAYSDYALDSFEFHVIDYLLKPVTFRRFMQAVSKLRASLPAPAGEGSVVAEPAPEETSADHMFVKSGRQLHKIQFSEIRYIEAMKEYLRIDTGKEKVLVYKRMKEMALLLPASFVRVHNSYIVNMNHVSSADAASVTVAGTVLPVSAGYRDGFMTRIRHYLV